MSARHPRTLSPTSSSPHEAHCKKQERRSSSRLQRLAWWRPTARDNSLIAHACMHPQVRARWGGQFRLKAGCSDDVELNVLGCRVDILGTSCDQCVCMVRCCFTSAETIRLIKTGSPGRPPRLSQLLISKQVVIGNVGQWFWRHPIIEPLASRTLKKYIYKKISSCFRKARWEYAYNFIYVDDGACSRPDRCPDFDLGGWHRVPQHVVDVPIPLFNWHPIVTPLSTSMSVCASPSASIVVTFLKSTRLG